MTTAVKKSLNPSAEVRISPDTAKRIAAKAKELGQDPQSYLDALLREDLSDKPLKDTERLAVISVPLPKYVAKALSERAKEQKRTIAQLFTEIGWLAYNRQLLVERRVVSPFRVEGSAMREVTK